MKLIKTVKCKLQVSGPERQILLETLRRFAATCNEVLALSKAHGTTNKVTLQHLGYSALKKKYDLQANLVIRAIARVAGASKKKRTPNAFKPTSMSLDARTFRFIEPTKQVSVSTHAGRLKLKLHIGNFQRGLLEGQKPTSATLCYVRRTGEFYIHIILSWEVAVPSASLRTSPSGSNLIGVDRGLKNIATTSKGVNFSGNQVLHIRRHYRKLRQALQAKGTKGANRLLRQLSGKESRWMREVNHIISRKIVDSLGARDVLVLENLKHLRERIKIRKSQRSDLHSWAFRQLQSFLEYKALEKAIPVKYVDPRYTSQRCPRCGYTSKSNRVHQALFRCRGCGYQHNADYVAALNIAWKAGFPGDGLSSASPGASTR